MNDKTNLVPDDPDELLPSFIAVTAALESQYINNLILERKWNDLSRKLRGGSSDGTKTNDEAIISKSQILLRGYALLELLPENKEDSKLSYPCNEKFRIYLQSFLQLDTVVEVAASQSKIDGGLVETMSMAFILPFGVADRMSKIMNERILSLDPRLNILNALGDTIKLSKAFVAIVQEALKE